ncbi:hypothetical protein BDR05DRAFT_844647, partial [Suillus weaverae]
CKLHAGGVHQFQNTKDKSSTANLKHHTIHCFGEDTINAAISGKAASECNGLIFALFAQNSKQPVKYSHCVHTNPEL